MLFGSYTLELIPIFETKILEAFCKVLQLRKPVRASAAIFLRNSPALAYSLYPPYPNYI